MAGTSARLTLVGGDGEFERELLAANGLGDAGLILLD